MPVTMFVNYQKKVEKVRGDWQHLALTHKIPELINLITVKKVFPFQDISASSFGVMVFWESKF